MRVRTVVPYDARTKPTLDPSNPEDFGNNFTLLTMGLPVDEADPIKRLYRVKATIDDLKISPEPIVAILLNQVRSFRDLQPPQRRSLATRFRLVENCYPLRPTGKPHMICSTGQSELDARRI
jgi:hypothetical protein